MAVIKSFKGLRFTDKAGETGELVCPPYDIISDKQREEYLKKNEYNIIRLELPRGEDAYNVAGKTLNEWISNQILAKDNKESIYVYEMEFKIKGDNVKKVKGFISLVKLEEFSKGIVLPHEETLSKAKVDRFNLMSATNCNFSQVYSLYMDEDRASYNLIDKASDRDADIEVTDKDNVIHRLWCVDDEKVVEAVERSFENKKLYIADGHHRYETALNYHKSLCEKGISDENSLSGYICMMLVNMENDGLVVFPTHRIVRDLESFDEDTVVEKCKQYFDIILKEDIHTAEDDLEEMYNKGETAFALYTSKKNYYLLVLKDKQIMQQILSDMSKAYCQLDVSVLHSLILERIFGIDKENMANQKNLTYTKISEEAIESVDSNEADCAFLLNPTRVSEIRDVALNSEKMPQKSTYFYPKLITGLVMNKFID